uniref:Apple domain-containing protein n=1 Tax=Romanomermis culicivorax TaxID=13658 RepID=A0A915JYB5_ROMCU
MNVAMIRQQDFQLKKLPDQATNCVVIMDRNHLLIRHNRKTVSVSSYDECIRQCRSAERQYFFTCNSGQYYADLKTDNCILNKETRKTLPDLYRATDDNNVYFELQCSTTVYYRQLHIE